MIITKYLQTFITHYLLALGVFLLVCLIGCNNRSNEGTFHKHNFTEWQIVEPTCTEVGSKKRICLDCGYEQSRIIPVSGHTFSDEWQNDGLHHWRVATCCEGVTGDYGEHTLGEDGKCPLCHSYVPLAGEFTVSYFGDKVRFIKGSLYYDGDEPKIEKNQYDFRTYSGKNSVIDGVYSATGTPEGNVGLFYWSKDLAKAIAPTYSDDGKSTSDNFVFVEGGAIKYFDVLDDDEWRFLTGLASYSTRKDKCGLGTIIDVGDEAGVKGVVLIPDEWSNPLTKEFVSDYNNGYATNTYTKAEWKLMESNGAVFLPAAGIRSGSNFTVNNINSEGKYWASEPDRNTATHAYYFNFTQAKIKTGCGYRDSGAAVRLVYRLKEE